MATKKIEQEIKKTEKDVPLNSDFQPFWALGYPVLFFCLSFRKLFQAKDF